MINILSEINHLKFVGEKLCLMVLSGFGLYGTLLVSLTEDLRHYHTVSSFSTAAYERKGDCEHSVG